MSRQSIVGAVLAASLLAPAAAMLVWREQGWPIVLFVLWTAAAAAAFVLADRRFERRRHARLLERMQHSAIETLSHHRHDWMNELQVLYGYLRLGKPDKAVAVVDRIRSRMEQDSRISRIGIPKLAAYFLSFRTLCDTMRLEVDVEDGFPEKSRLPDEEKLASAVIGLVNAYRLRASAPAAEENVLRLSFRSEAADMLLEVSYRGRLAASDSLDGELKRVLEGCGVQMEAPSGAAESDERLLIVAFPLNEKAV